MDINYYNIYLIQLLFLRHYTVQLFQVRFVNGVTYIIIILEVTKVK